MDELNSRSLAELDEDVVTGKILHLDGDRYFSEKSFKYYQKMGVNAIVKNIPESRQPMMVYNLLSYYKPDILVITGHDSMIKKKTGYYNLYNYENSKYFVQTVREARRYEKDTNSDLVIFAGACQSFFEALIQAGANFASSPERIFIDILDPLIVAKEVATTDYFKYINMQDIEGKLRDGKRGIGGIGAMRKESKKKEIIIVCSKRIVTLRFLFFYYNIKTFFPQKCSKILALML